MTAWTPEAGSLNTETEEQSGASDVGLQLKLMVRIVTRPEWHSVSAGKK